jgi:subtilase family serine protease
MPRRCRLATRPRLEILDQRLVLSALTPAQIDSAYGLNAVAFSNGAIKGNGAGQTIAIIDPYHDPAIYGDLLAFDARNGLSNPALTASLPPSYPASLSASPIFTMVNFAGTQTNAGWNSEEALDVEMAHAAAPGANLVLVEAATSGLSSLITAIQATKTIPSVSVVSMSWEGPEFNGQQSFDSVFTTPIGHEGITFLCSSGDTGAGAEWPASSPNVLSIGGTSLLVSTTGARVSESAWVGSGGGLSQLESKPSYQSQVVSGTARSTPDVAIDADPNTGVMINSWGNQYQTGGTSLAAPIWAGLLAIADQGLALAGHSTLDGATQTLPDLYRAPSGSFYDVTTGNRAKAGYDGSTGLGTPNAPTLIKYLDGGSNLSPNAGAFAIELGSTTGTGSSVSVPMPPAATPALIVSGGEPSPTESPSPLVAVPLPIVPMDQSAVDEALAGWDLGGTSPFASWSGRSKPRG